MSTRTVIIGGGLAGATAAEELRKLGYDGAIELLAAERHRPYARPPLSKGYLAGSEELEGVFVHPEGWELEHGVVLRTGIEARRIAGRVVELAGGGRRVVLIGSGWIGLELAAAARGYGNEVTVVSRDRTPLATALGEELGEMFRELHEQNGVVFLPEREVAEIETDGDGGAAGVRTGHETVPADIVLVGIGAVPDTAVAETAGLRIDGGILVDERMRTSAPDVFAAGDVANPMHPVLGARLRSEHWANAIASGKVAASSMLGGDAVLDDIPYFYTDQYDLGMEYSGYAPLASDAELVIRGDRAARELIAFWGSDGRVVAGMNVNVWDVNEEIQRLIRDRVAVDRERLADPAVELVSLV